MGTISQQIISQFNPCPKCLAKVGITLDDRDDYSEDGETYYEVTCNNCGIQTRPFLTKKSAIEDWNKRPETPASYLILKAQVEDLKEVLNHLIEAVEKKFSKSPMQNAINIAKQALNQ